jgi:hypothetical protein
LKGTGPYELMEAGNQIDTLAFNVPANQVDVRDGDADALVLNNVDGVAGAIAANVVLQNDANTVTQFNAVSATGLLLRGAGNFTLTNAGNDVTTFASDSTGNQSYTDATGLVIGSVTPQTGAAVNGIDSSLGGGNVTLTALAGGAVVDQDVDTGAGNLTITTTGGDITQGVGDTITSAGTSTFTAGAGGNLITLNTNVNNFGTLEATGSTVRIQEFDAVVLNDITATTFDLDADGAVTQNGGTSIQTANVRFLGNGNFTLTQANDADTIAANIGDFLTFTDSDDLIVGSVLGTNGITTTGDIVTLIAGAGGVTVSQAVSTGGAVAGNIDFTTTGTIALNAALTAGTGDILLNSGTGVSQTVELSGAGLLLEGTGPFSLTDVDNDVNTIAADSVSGLIDFVDADGFAVGTVQGINGVITTTAAVDTVDLEAVAGNITIGQVLTTNGSDITVIAPGNMAINALVTAGLGDIILDADGAVTQTAALSGAGLLLLGVGSYDLNDVANDVDTLAVDVTGEVDFADSNDFVLGAVQGVDLVTTGADLVLQAASGTVTQTREIQLAAGNLLLSGAGNFTLTDVNNSIGAIASNATGNISYTDVADINVGSVTDLDTATVNGIDSSLGGGNVTLTALAGGAVVDQDVDTGAGNLTITTTGGDITQGVGDTITSAGTSTFTAGAGGNLITLNTNVNNFGTLEATGSTVRIQEFDAVVLNDITATTFDLDADGAVTQNGGTSIQTANVRFLGNGNFTLTQANDADTIAANIGDFLTFTDSDDLIVGSVLGTDGITTTGDTVTLIAGAGGITVSEAVSTGGAVAGNINFTTTGTIALNAALTAGTGDILLNSGTGVSQTVELSGAGLLLEGTGPFSLTDVDNDMNTIAADSVSGLIDFVDANGFAVGTVNDATATPVNGVITTTAAVDTVDLEAVAGNITIGQVLTTNESAITVTTPGNLAVNAAVTRAGATPASGNITFDVGTNLTLDAAVASGPDNLILNVDGAASQTVAATGTGLELIGNGSFNLTGANNDFTDIAGDISGGAGSIAYAEADDINVGSVGSIGLTTAAQDIAISSVGGPITVSQIVDTGTVPAGGNATLTTTGGGTTIDLDAVVRTGNGDFILDAGGAVNQSVAFTDVAGLELLDAGPFNLNIAGGNEVTDLAANVSGDVTYVDQDALNIATVNFAGATLAGNVLDIETINGGLTVSQAVVSNGGNIILDVGTTAGGTLTFNNTVTSDAGDITATTTGNISQGAAGAVTSTGTSTFTANAGSADIDLTAAANAFGTLVVTANQAEVAQVGVALDLGNIDAAIFSLSSDSAVTQSGIIDDTTGTNSLLLLGAGPFRLTQAGNDIGTLAAAVTGNMTYRDVDSYAVGTVLVVDGITTVTPGVVISLIANGLLNQTQPITATGVGTGLHLQGNGPFSLDGPANDVTILAADVSGQLDFEATNGLTIDSLTNTEGITDNGVNTNGNLLDLVAGGNIRINQPVATGAGEILVFDAGGTIFLSYAGTNISTSHVNGLSLNDLIILEANSTLDTSAGTGDIDLGAAATINDDAGASDYTLLIDAGGDISLGADVGATTQPVDLTLTAGGGNANPAAGTDIQVSQDFLVSAGTTYNMAGQTVSAGRHVGGAGAIDITGTATVTAIQNIQVGTLTVNNVAGTATINVGANLTSTFTPGDNLDDSDTDSTVVFTNATANGSAGAYSFHNLTINDPGNTITSTGDWTVYGTLTLTDGNWTLGANTHTIWGSWNSTLNAFAFNAAGSTVVFDGPTAATLLTDGIGTEAFNNITFDKSTGIALSLANVAGNTLEVLGNLTIIDGQFSARIGATPGWDIHVSGNWTDSTIIGGDGFVHRNGTVTFVGGASNVNVGTGITPYFQNLIIRDSSAVFVADNVTIGSALTIDAATVAASAAANADLTVNGAFTIDAAGAAATFTSGGVFTSNGTVTLQGANSPVIDFTNQDFHFDGGADSLDNTLGDADAENLTSGEIRLTGEQAVQDFPAVTGAPGGQEFLYGLVTYYNGAGAGQIVPSTHIAGGTEAWFWNLTIDAPARTITMACDVTVWGFAEPNGDGTLTNAVAVNPTILNGLRILNGTLSAENGPTHYDLILYGLMLTTNTNTNTTLGGRSYYWGATPIADPNGATVEFRGSHPTYIEGNNTFFRFLVNSGTETDPIVDPQPSDGTVAGKNFYFEAGSNTTIADDADARFVVVGTNTGAADNPFGNDPGWISLLSGTDGTYWDFNKLANAIAYMRNVYVQDSDASANPIVIQIRVIVSNCPGWVDFVYVTLSRTRDQLNNYVGTADASNELPTLDNTLYNPDGRIDRIQVTVQAAVVKDFSDFEVEVDGYNVLGYDPGIDVGDVETLASNQFWIILEEGDYLDTGATPAWRILNNTTVIDSSTGDPVAIYTSKAQEIPYDGAPPVIGYTLGVADSPRNEVFVHFSEPVVDTVVDGSEIDQTNFTTAVGGGVASISRISPFPAPTDNGMREAILNLAGPINAGDITGNTLNLTVNNVRDIATPNSPLADDATDPADTTMAIGDVPASYAPVSTPSPNHRISDIALGIVGNGIVEPVSAIGQTQPSGGSGVGIVTNFDGSDFLQQEDIVLQVHRYTGEAFTPDLYWENENSIPNSYKNSGLWLPTTDEVANSGVRPFSGLVPRPWSPGPGSATMSPVAGDLFDNSNPVPPPATVWSPGGKIIDGADLDFFFLIAPNLYAARCEDDTASDWYRRIRPWSIKIRDVVTQAGGISILNNIINPNRNERTSLHYTLSRGGTVTIQVFDLAGGLVEILQRGYQDAGEYAVAWDGRNRSGNVVARGIYFIRYVGPGGIDQIRKVLVVK